MKTFFTFLILMFFSFFSIELMSQSVKVTQIKSEKQLISGKNVSINTSKLKRALPISIVSFPLVNKKVLTKKTLIEKPSKVLKYNKINSKRDED